MLEKRGKNKNLSKLSTASKITLIYAYNLIFFAEPSSIIFLIMFSYIKIAAVEIICCGLDSSALGAEKLK